MKISAQHKNRSHMSSNIDWVVDIEAMPDESEALAQRVVAHLLEKGIIVVNAAAGNEHGPPYKPGPNAEGYSAQVCRDLRECGFFFTAERTVFDSGDNGVQGLTCPRCHAVHNEDELPWSDAIDGWYAGADGDLTCGHCAKPASITEWRFLELDWGFGNLGFGFHGWSISPKMTDEIATVLRHQVQVVHQHL